MLVRRAPGQLKNCGLQGCKCFEATLPNHTFYLVQIFLFWNIFSKSKATVPPWLQLQLWRQHAARSVISMVRAIHCWKNLMKVALGQHIPLYHIDLLHTNFVHGIHAYICMFLAFLGNKMVEIVWILPIWRQGCIYHTGLNPCLLMSWQCKEPGH